MANSATSAVKSQIPGAHKAMLARMKRREFDKMRKLNKTRAKVQSSVKRSFGEEITRDNIIDALVEMGVAGTAVAAGAALTAGAAAGTYAGMKAKKAAAKFIRNRRLKGVAKQERKADVANSKVDVANSKAALLRAKLGERDS